MKGKIIVFGGTGDVGQLVVKKLLNGNHSVVVLTRQEKSSSDNLDFVIGDVLDDTLVGKIINPDDSVIITLGFNNSSQDTMSRGTANIISAMNKKGVKRLVCLSAQGAGDSWDYMPDDFKKMVSADKILSASFKDHSIQEEIVKQSNLDWTIVRPTEIISGKESGTFTINRPSDNSKFQISNSDVAQFIVTALEEGKYVRQVAMITD